MTSDVNSKTLVKPSVLLVEEDTITRASLAKMLTRGGFTVQEAASADEGLEKIICSQFEVILCDYDLKNTDLEGLISRIKAIDSQPAILVITSEKREDTALRALSFGAQDFISRPIEADSALITVRKAIKRVQFYRNKSSENVAISSSKFNFSNIIAQSESMKEIFETVRRLAAYNTTILITGESGTGKELLARAIHNNSPRKNKPFVAINCGAIPENLMESELFGHKKGAFTDATRDKRGLLEEASGGTILLDEIGELPLHLQVKLLRVLQEQQIRRVGDEQVIDVNLRVVAATLRDLEQDITSGRFRDDLFYRLNVVSIHIPPLRERPEDISLLANYFLKKHSRSLGIPIDGISDEAMLTLQSYYWRGNVRELENCIERALVLCESNLIDVESLPEMVKSLNRKTDANQMLTEILDDNLSIKQRTRALEIDLMLRALKKTGGNRTHAAKILEISHRALLYKLKEYGLGEA